MTIYQAPLMHDGEFFLHADNAIVMHQNKVVEILTTDIPSTVIRLQGLICPAFINAHCHLELSFLKDLIPQKTGFVSFAQHINKLRDSFTTEEKIAAVTEAIGTSHKNGIQAIGDICNGTESLFPKLHSELLFHNFIEIFGLRKDKIDENIARSTEVFAAFSKQLRTSYAPHATYSLNEHLWQKMQPLWSSPCTLHNQESLAEDAYIRNGQGEFVHWFKQFAADDIIAAQEISPLQYALSQIGNLQHLLFVHNTFTTASDVQKAQEKIKNRYWVTCPSANLYIENTMPDNYEILMALQENICIGTDSLASNSSLDIWKEIKLIQDAKNIPLETILQWATSNGAKALQLPTIGKLSANSDAKIIHIQDIDASNAEEAIITYL